MAGKNVLRSLFIFGCGMVFVFLLVLDSSSAVEITVDDDGSGDYTSIGEALMAADDGDVIVVEIGTYHENIVVRNSVHIVGRDRDKTIIHGGSDVIAVRLKANGIVFENFTVRNGALAGIRVEGDNIEISSCAITQNGVGIAFQEFGGDAEVKEVWNSTFGGANDDVLSHGTMTSDGGHIMIGRTTSFGGNDIDVWVVKLDAEGSEEWSRVYEKSSDEDSGYYVLETSDGGFLLTAVSRAGPGWAGVWVIKTDRVGDIEWDRGFGGSEADRGQVALEISDGGYLIGGYTRSMGDIDKDGYLIRTNETGARIWEKKYGGSDREEIYSLLEVPGRGFLAVGITESFGASNLDVYALLVDGDGEIIWEENYDSPGNARGLEVKMIGQEFWITGYEDVSGYGNQALVIRIDSEGNLIKSRTFGGPGSEVFRRMQIDDEGNLIIFGDTSSYGYGNGESDAWVVRMDRDFHESWNFTFGGSLDDACKSGMFHNNELVIHAGSQSYGEGNADFWVVKIRTVSEDVLIRSCSVSSNLGTGIDVHDARNVDISGTSIFGNGGDGIGLRDTRDIVCSGNDILGNGMVGMNILNITDLEIRDSNISGNTGDGIRIGGKSSIVRMEGNIITLNENGIIARGGSNGIVAQDNHIFDNGMDMNGYGVNASYNSGVFIDVKRNWWGDPSGPFHAIDNIGGEGNAISKNVYFYPWLMRPLDYYSPEAFITVLTPKVQLLNHSVAFECEGTGYTTIVGYRWTSNIDGILANESVSSFETSDLSPGVHIILCAVKDGYGEWSTDVNGTVTIHERPTVRIDPLPPGEVKEEDDINLSCVASDDGEVVLFVWTSSIDGTIYKGVNASFEISNLSVGTHSITLSVQDNFGVWSDEVNTSITVKEKKHILFDEIGPLPLIAYIAAASLILLLVLVVVISKMRNPDARPSKGGQWPSIGQQRPGMQVRQMSAAGGPPPQVQAAQGVPPSYPSPPGQAPIPFPTHQSGPPGPGVPGVQSQPYPGTVPRQPSQAGYQHQQPGPHYPTQQSPQFPQPQQPQHPQQSSYPLQQGTITQPQTAQDWVCPQCRRNVEGKFSFCITCGYRR